MPINKDTPTSEIIDDFVHSKNPKFKGKSKAERIKQAVAASYKVHGEEVEESNNTPYVKKSKTNPNAWDAMNKHGKVKTFGAEFKDAAMRHAGIAEETELDEARGRPKKDLGYTINPNNKEKLYHDNPEHMDRIRRLRKNGVLPPEQHAPSEHIINRLRQASTNQTGGQDIKYENGKTHNVSGSMASRTLDHYNGLSKPADKEAFQSKIRKSHEEHKSALEEEVMSEETKAPLWGVSATNKFRTLDEETQIDELSKGTMGSYIKKASHDVATHSAATGRYAERSQQKKKTGEWWDGKKESEVADKAFDKSWKRREGIGKAVDKMTKEEAELEEKKLIGKQKKLDKNHNGHLDAEDFKMLRKEELMDQFADALEEGIFDESDIDRLVENELDRLDELSNKTMHSYMNKNEADREKLAGAIGISKDGETVGDKTKQKNKLDSRVRMDILASKKTYPNIGWDKPAKVNATEENISESNEPKVTPYTAANRYHAVESAVRDIMSQNQNLKKIAEEETFRRNNPGLFKDK